MIGTDKETDSGKPGLVAGLDDDYDDDLRWSTNISNSNKNYCDTVT